MLRLASFVHRGHRVSYEVHGRGPRVLVYGHGLLLGSGINRSIAARLATAGHRVVLPDLLGHGRSDKPTHAYEHRLEFYSEQVVGLLDHLAVDRCVVGGVSLGANVALDVAVTHPERVRGLVAEMPVLERGGASALAAFFPLLLGLRYGGPVVRPLTRLARSVPRTRLEIVDAFLDAASSDPREMAAVLHGLFVGPGSPPARVRRELRIPALVVGHRGDLLHPLNDATALAEELPLAELVRSASVFEARTSPRRLVRHLDRFLHSVYDPDVVPALPVRPAAPPRRRGRGGLDRTGHGQRSEAGLGIRAAATVRDER